MKTVLKRVISSVLIIQVLLMPGITITAFAAAPFDAAGSPMVSTPSATATGLSGTKDSVSPFSAYQTDSYFTDSYGNILMNINIWGEVGKPGQLVVPEGSDISTLISLAGGPLEDANLKKIRVNRFQPDENGKMTYLINLKTYTQTGDRSSLIALQPNDTVIIPKSKALTFLDILGVIGVGVGMYSVLDD